MSTAEYKREHYKTVNIRVKPEVKEKWQMISVASGIPVSKMISIAVDEYAKKRRIDIDKFYSG